LIDALFDVAFPQDPVRWRTDVAPLGALKKTILEDKRGAHAAYVTPEVRALVLFSASYMALILDLFYVLSYI
jgi:hypothetical protein